MTTNINIDDLKAEEAYARKWHRRQKLGRLEDRYAPRRHKWRVYKSTITGRWNITHYPTNNRQDTIAWSRNTHAEALAYADCMARTRTYVLPRPDKDGYVETTDEQIAWENTEFERTVVSVAWIEEPGTICLSTGDSDHYMTTDGAHSIALALAALAEQERSCEK